MLLMKNSVHRTVLSFLFVAAAFAAMTGRAEAALQLGAESDQPGIEVMGEPSESMPVVEKSDGLELGVSDNGISSVSIFALSGIEAVVGEEPAVWLGRQPARVNVRCWGLPIDDIPRT